METGMGLISGMCVVIGTPLARLGKEGESTVNNSKEKVGKVEGQKKRERIRRNERRYKDVEEKCKKSEQ